MSETTLTVSEITRLIKQELEGNFSAVSVVGEISNFKAHSSGHWYFTLKDSDAQISCTMWRGVNNYVFFSPQDGMKVTIIGRITVYPPRGNYQIEVRAMQPAGVGELQLAFEKLKEKLQREGLFDQERKKEIPEFPMKIGIVTSIGAAALKDMISVATRRFPLTELLIAPCTVQGSNAAESIAAAIKLLNYRNDVEVIIVARGGGSLEDLWAFNEEVVAYAIYKSKIPVVTGIGHEIDFTIADFVADYRAATPTAAMEILTPEKQELENLIRNYDDEITEKVFEKIDGLKEQVASIVNSYGFRSPIDMLKLYSQQVDTGLYKLNQSVEKYLNYQKNRTALVTSKLSSHDVQKTLSKGFVLVKQEDKFVTRAKKFQTAKSHTLIFYDDKIHINKNYEEKN
ncbi:MAG: exodeoxyribonuclease VII large subunit [Ignavibacteriaceae bacterium]|jgi:exodeoxyribonuclease VII large subunit